MGKVETDLTFSRALATIYSVSKAMMGSGDSELPGSLPADGVSEVPVPLPADGVSEVPVPLLADGVSEVPVPLPADGVSELPGVSSADGVSELSGASPSDGSSGFSDVFITVGVPSADKASPLTVYTLPASIATVRSRLSILFLVL